MEIKKKGFTLAEGATHVGTSNTKRKFAFTLAEVLITLGIIGVVSVLTIPNIISNYQKKVYVTQLQKGYAQLQQLFDMAMADDEVEYLADTELVNSINGPSIGWNRGDDQSAFISQLGKYMKIQKACQIMDFSDGCHDVYYVQLDDSDNYIDEEDGYSKAGSNRGGDLQIFTKDGMIYYFNYFKKNLDSWTDTEFCDEYKADGATSCSYHGYLRVDVNGKKGPNKFGRDLFVFMADERGQVHPLGSSTIEGRKHAWDGEIGSVCDFRSCTTDSYGTGCAARIMDQGWVMDY